jgi:hypothetical protein
MQMHPFRPLYLAGTANATGFVPVAVGGGAIISPTDGTTVVATPSTSNSLLGYEQEMPHQILQLFVTKNATDAASAVAVTVQVAYADAPTTFETAKDPSGRDLVVTLPSVPAAGDGVTLHIPINATSEGDVLVAGRVNRIAFVRATLAATGGTASNYSVHGRIVTPN